MAKATVIITAQDQLSKGLREAQQSVMKFDNTVSKVSNTIAKAFNVASISTGLMAIKKAAADCINEFAGMERVMLRTSKVWENVGTSLNITNDELTAYADSIETSTYFSAEAVKEAGLLLAATESLSEDGFKQALSVSIDLAEAMGTDVPSAASTLSRALQDPEAGLSRLKSIGVSFTDAETDMIKKLQESGRTFEAQEVILDKVEQKYKGIAQAVASTPTNTLTQIANTMGDIKEGIGKGLVYALQPAFDFILNNLRQVSEWVNRYGSSTAVVSALQSGATDFSAFSVAEIELALKSLQTAMQSNRQQDIAHRDSFARYIEILNKEIEDRQNSSTSSGSTTVDAGSVAVINAVDNLESFFNSYGKSSQAYQKKAYEEIIEQAQELQEQLVYSIDDLGPNFRLAAYELGLTSEQEVQNAYNVLAQIIESYSEKILDLEKTDAPTTSSGSVPGFLETGGNLLAGDLSSLFGFNLDKAGVFSSSVIDSFIGSIGEAGEVVSKLSTNMATMGPVLGSIFTALEYVLEGFGEAIAPLLNVVTELVIKPFTELGHALASLFIPILQVLIPVLQAVIKPFIVVTGTIQYVGQVLQHWVASIMNWLAGLNLLGWRPFAGLRMSDPGSPGNFIEYIKGKLSEVDNIATSADSTATSTAISSAGYRGATSVTINIYQQSPVVGSNGMREFAAMIKDEFDNLNYYGVTA